MKETIFLWIIMTIFAAVPVIASCSLTGICSNSIQQNFLPQTMQDKYIPNNLNVLQNSLPPAPQNENFIQGIQQNYGLNNPENSRITLPSEKSYNTACQLLGTCLP